MTTCSLFAQRTLWVDQRVPAASDGNPGTEAQPFKTINAAAQVAEPGDTVRVRAGTYRERVAPARGGTEQAPITYEAMPGETVEVKGSDAWSGDWRVDPDHPRVFSSAIPGEPFAQAPNPYRIGISIAGGDARIAARPVPEDARDKPWPRTLGQVFVQGEPLTQVESMAMMRRMEGSWIVSADGETLHVHLPGAASPDMLLPTLEWSVRNRIFAPRRRGLSHIHVRGFAFLHCANQGPFPQGGAVSTRTGQHWVIEGNTIRFAKTVGLDIGSETWGAANLDDTDEEDRKLMVQAGHIVRGNVISDNGLCGIAGWNSPDVRILNNILERNNRLHFSNADARWEEWAAIKLHNSNALIAHNTIRFNEAHGIWIDNGYNLARITGNVLLGNVGSGIMLELGAGTCLIDNNVVSHTRSYGGFYDGNAIYAHDASGLTVVHNLLTANAGAGVLMRTITKRTYGGKIVTTSGTQILNNVFDNNQKGDICLPFENPRSSGNRSDWNVFTRKPSFRLNKYQDEFQWQTVLDKLQQAGIASGPESTDAQGEGAFRQFGLEAWRAATDWDTNSVVVEKAGFAVLPYRMLMRANLPEAWKDLRVPAVDEMTVDFAGAPMATDALVEGLEGRTARPGPLQHLEIGATEISLAPLRPAETPALRRSREVREADAGRLRIERAQKTIEAAAGQGTNLAFSLTAALKDGTLAGPWSRGRQEGSNPAPTAPLAGRVGKPVGSLHAQSAKGVSSSPADCLVFTAPQDGRYAIDLDVALTKRGSASAGTTLVSLHLVDGGFRDALPIWKAELNTPDGYRGKTLGETAAFRDVVACPAGFHLLLRFQIVAPGPASAGIGTLDIRKFDIASPAD